MPNTSLRSALDALGHSFAMGVLQAIRSASIEDLHAESGGRAARGGKPRAKTTNSGRLTRRSDEQIAKAVGEVVALLKKNKAGLRAEQIKKSLGLDVREMPRILRTGMASKRLKKRGQKRATVYTAR